MTKIDKVLLGSIFSVLSIAWFILLWNSTVDQSIIFTIIISMLFSIFTLYGVIKVLRVFFDSADLLNWKKRQKD
ncbi:hypothetical protein M3202_21265 [Alkalihalobacillus oceani]|uniref:Uncharacterized protein n=1 Tax=Halalkalibacter oceani TaxID=1653776 RepID=A0A9X2DW11_9BACI|nr:hypothetical protein [Halalkalibacter oceani]MCM3716577.1 hypothetical protein [Halalkalibacter oceani]